MRVSMTGLPGCPLLLRHGPQRDRLSGDHVFAPYRSAHAAFHSPPNRVSDRLALELILEAYIGRKQR